MIRAWVLTLAAALLAPTVVALAIEAPGLPVGVPTVGATTNYIAGLYEYPRDIAVGDSYDGATVVKTDSVLHFLVLQTDGPALLEARLATDENVRYFHVDGYDFHADLTPNDPLFASSQYGPQKIGAPAAWDATLGSTSVKLCVTDTGLRATHQDIAGRVVGGYNFDASTTNYADGNGHGTHVTTTAAGITNNGVGIAGIAQVSVLVAKVLNDAGSGTYSAIASGIRWCADQGAKVISSSLGGSTGDVSLSDAVSYAWSKGAVLVAAAGNSGPCSNCVGYPAKYANEIAVSCTDSNNALCSFSSTGPEVDIAAPGYNIIAGWYTSDTATNTISGTSMSTPHVAGVAALVASKNPTWTNQQIRDALQNNAQDLGAAGLDSSFGYGLVRADRAVGSGGTTPPPPPPSETTVYSESFDAGTASGWTQAAVSGTSLWRLSTTCVSAYSPSYSLQYNQASTCTYSTGARTAGHADKSVSLAGKTTSAHLAFKHWFQVESYTGGAYDVMKAQYSCDGTTFTTLGQWDSRNGSSGGWLSASYDVSACKGGTLYIRFNFDSVDGTSNAFAGWAVDNVVVTAA